MKRWLPLILMTIGWSVYLGGTIANTTEVRIIGLPLIAVGAGILMWQTIGAIRKSRAESRRLQERLKQSTDGLKYEISLVYLRSSVRRSTRCSMCGDKHPSITQALAWHRGRLAWLERREADMVSFFGPVHPSRDLLKERDFVDNLQLAAPIDE